MADTFPSGYVDQKTGKIESFQNSWSKLTDETAPNAGHWVLQAAKVSMLAPFIGGLAIALPVAAGVYFGGRHVLKKSLNMLHDREEREGGAYREYDFTDAADRAAFTRAFRDTHPQFVDDLQRMVKLSGLSEMPKVRVMYPGQGEEDYNCSATTRPDGTAPVVTLGRSAMADLNPAELRAVMAHELTHVKLGHIKDGADWMARSALGGVLNAALVGAALFAGAPVLPVLGFIAVTNLVGKCLRAVQSRRHEEMCDHGAALMTGETASLASALKKVHKGLLNRAQQKVNLKYMRRGEVPPKVEEASGVSHFLFASHPTTERRAKLLKEFEENHKSYCEKQRAGFRSAFNNAAAAPAAQPKPQQVIVLKPRSGAPKYKAA